MRISRIAFHNFDDMQRCISGADIAIVPLASGPFRGSSIHTGLGDVFLSAGRFQGSVRSRGVFSKDVLLGIQLNERSEVFQFGRPALVGDVFIVPAGAEQDGRATGDNSYATVSVSMAALADMGVLQAMDLAEKAWTSRNHFSATPVVRASVAHAVSTTVNRILSPELPAEPQQIGALGRSLLMLFLIGIASSHETNPGRGTVNSFRLVRQAEDWLAGQTMSSVHVLSLCRALGVSLRTLQRAFRETLDIGPVHYLTMWRLAHARAALLAAGESGTVTSVALAHGFDELGRFAGFYRRVYGELPSQTLSQARRGSFSGRSPAKATCSARTCRPAHQDRR